MNDQEESKLCSIVKPFLSLLRPSVNVEHKVRIKVGLGDSTGDEPHEQHGDFSTPAGGPVQFGLVIFGVTTVGLMTTGAICRPGAAKVLELVRRGSDVGARTVSSFGHCLSGYVISSGNQSRVYFRNLANVIGRKSTAAWSQLVAYSSSCKRELALQQPKLEHIQAAHELLAASDSLKEDGVAMLRIRAFKEYSCTSYFILDDETSATLGSRAESKLQALLLAKQVPDKVKNAIAMLVVDPCTQSFLDDDWALDDGCAEYYQYKISMVYLTDGRGGQKSLSVAMEMAGCSFAAADVIERVEQKTVREPVMGDKIERGVQQAGWFNTYEKDEKIWTVVGYKDTTEEIPILKKYAFTQAEMDNMKQTMLRKAAAATRRTLGRPVQATGQTLGQNAVVKPLAE